MTATKRQEVKIKNNPGIYKLQEWDISAKKWIDSGKFRSTRRVRIEGSSKRETAVFSNYEDAKDYRLGKIDKSSEGGHHKERPVVEDNRMRFKTLVEHWKTFHYAKVDLATQQNYNRRLPPVSAALDNLAVEDINVRVIDSMIVSWKALGPSKCRDRHSYAKELDALKVILNFYRKRFNPRFSVEIYRDHYDASKIKVVVKKVVRSLTRIDFGKFLKALAKQKNPIYFPMALTQFCLSLRIGEVCGLKWTDFDFKAMTVRIERTIVWDDLTTKPREKECPKNGYERVLAIPEILRFELQKLHKMRDVTVEYVFHRNGEPLIRKSIGRAYNRALEVCGISYVTGTHLLRKTSATQANIVTGDFYAVSKNLGHSSVEETKRYVDEVGSDKRKVANALNEVALSVLEGGLAHNGPQAS